MQHPYKERGPSTARTVDTVRADFQSFLRDGARKHRAKEVSFSVIREPRMPIEIDHISCCLPTRTILGLFSA